LYIPRNPDEQSTRKRMVIPRENGCGIHVKTDRQTVPATL
jgi:hypothetical protein